MARNVSAISGRAVPATGSTRLESVVVMISPASHGSDGATSRVLPEISLRKARYDGYDGISVPSKPQQRGALGVVPDGSRVTR